MPLALASRYARALADIVLAPGGSVTAEDAIKQIAQFEDVLKSSDELRNVLLSPAVRPARKRAVVSKLGEQFGTSKVVRNFLFVVMDRRRIGMLSEIRGAFQMQLDERLGIVRAHVQSAHELSAVQRASIEGQLSRLSGKGVRGEFAIDPNLIGGAVARVGSTIYDGSVRGRLRALRRKLVEA